MKLSKVLYGKFFTCEVEFSEEGPPLWIMLTDRDRECIFFEGALQEAAEKTIEEIIAELKTIKTLINKWQKVKAVE